MVINCILVVTINIVVTSLQEILHDEFSSVARSNSVNVGRFQLHPLLPRIQMKRNSFVFKRKGTRADA